MNFAISRDKNEFSQEELTKIKIFSQRTFCYASLANRNTKDKDIKNSTQIRILETNLMLVPSKMRIRVWSKETPKVYKESWITFEDFFYSYYKYSVSKAGTTARYITNLSYIADDIATMQRYYEKFWHDKQKMVVRANPRTLDKTSAERIVNNNLKAVERAEVKHAAKVAKFEDYTKIFTILGSQEYCLYFKYLPKDWKIEKIWTKDGMVVSSKPFDRLGRFNAKQVPASEEAEVQTVINLTKEVAPYMPSMSKIAYGDTFNMFGKDWVLLPDKKAILKKYTFKAKYNSRNETLDGDYLNSDIYLKLGQLAARWLGGVTNARNS